MMSRSQSFLGTVAAFLTLAGVAHGQAVDPTRTPLKGSPAAGAAAPPPGAKQGSAFGVRAPAAEDSNAAIEKALADVSARLDARDKELEELRAADKATAAQIRALKDQVQATSAEVSVPMNERLLTFWGYMDAGFTKAWPESPIGGSTAPYPSPSSFYSTGINLFVKSELSSTFSVLVETQLTYTPSGAAPSSVVTGQPVTNAAIYINGKLGPAALQRTNAVQPSTNYYRDPVSYLGYRQNGLVIQRAYFDWRAFDWLTIRAGRFLTPYGIWNEDHGSPVLLAAFTPYLVASEYVPNQQTGIQLFGSRDIADGWSLDYAGTISNGRGPQDDYRDLDDNKALGLRLKLAYHKGDFLVRLGGYGYVGSYASSSEVAIVKLRSNFTLDPSAHPSVGVGYQNTEAYDEKAATVDLQLRYKGLRVYAEAAFRDLRYTTAPDTSATAALTGAPVTAVVYNANHQGSAFLVLGGYEFNLGKSLANVRVTPYGGVESVRPDDTQTFNNADNYRFGLNIKPTAYVTAKLEANRIITKAAPLDGNTWVTVAQVAVAF